MLDMTAWISVLGLLDECPVLPAALTAVLEGRTTTVSPTAFDFISTAAQIGDVRIFMRKLPDVLSRLIRLTFRRRRRSASAGRRARRSTGRTRSEAAARESLQDPRRERQAPPATGSAPGRHRPSAQGRTQRLQVIQHAHLLEHVRKDSVD